MGKGCRGVTEQVLRICHSIVGILNAGTVERQSELQALNKGDLTQLIGKNF